MMKQVRQTARLSVFFTSEEPPHLAKHFELVDGTLKKDAVAHLAHLAHGTVEKRTVAGLKDLEKLVTGLQSNQALSYGICKYDRATIVTKAAYERIDSTAIVTRSREHFSWPEGPSVRTEAL